MVYYNALLYHLFINNLNYFFKLTLDFFSLIYNLVIVYFNDNNKKRMVIITIMKDLVINLLTIMTITVINYFVNCSSIFNNFSRYFKYFKASSSLNLLEFKINTELILDF